MTRFLFRHMEKISTCAMVVIMLAVISAIALTLGGM